MDSGFLGKSSIRWRFQAVIVGNTNWYSIKLKQFSTGKVGITHNTDDSFNTTLSENTWHHVVVVSTGSEVQLYINGNYDSELTATSATTLGLPLHKLGYTCTGTDKLAAFR